MTPGEKSYSRKWQKNRWHIKHVESRQQAAHSKERAACSVFSCMVPVFHDELLLLVVVNTWKYVCARRTRARKGHYTLGRLVYDRRREAPTMRASPSSSSSMLLLSLLYVVITVCLSTTLCYEPIDGAIYTTVVLPLLILHIPHTVNILLGTRALV